MEFWRGTRGQNGKYRFIYQNFMLVGAEGFEPPTLCSQNRYSVGQVSGKQQEPNSRFLSGARGLPRLFKELQRPETLNLSLIHI